MFLGRLPPTFSISHYLIWGRTVNYEYFAVLGTIRLKGSLIFMFPLLVENGGALLGCTVHTLSSLLPHPMACYSIWLCYIKLSNCILFIRIKKKRKSHKMKNIKYLEAVPYLERVIELGLALLLIGVMK